MGGTLEYDFVKILKCKKDFPQHTLEGLAVQWILQITVATMKPQRFDRAAPSGRQEIRRNASG